MATLVQAAWGAVRTRGSIFQRKYQRWRKRMGERSALVAVCHALLEVAYHILKNNQPYAEQDADRLAKRDKDKCIQHHAHALRKLGAEEATIQALIAQLTTPEPVVEAEPPISRQPPDDPAGTRPGVCSKARKRRIQSAVARRGALGFRARQTTSQTRSNFQRPMEGYPLREPSEEKARNAVSTDQT
jgi:hypothetical protein